jgi:histidinol-phosphate/aromatic aminotransferase/cobyric acid decarboxylase-like protein
LFWRLPCIRPARRLADIAPFHVVELLTRARQLEAEGRDIIHMEVGEPDFPTPEPIANAAVDAIKQGKTLYTQALGLPELREAISGFYRSRYGVAVPAARIAVTSGASGALNLAFACLAEPGSEWLLTDPGYPVQPPHSARLRRSTAEHPGRTRQQLPADPRTAAPALERSDDRVARRLARQPDRHPAHAARDRGAGRSLPRVPTMAISWSTRSITA